MALYAFDGTWNVDKEGSEKDTNVIWFRDAYAGTVSYVEGVGTRLGVFGKVFGGITGAGGHKRVHEMVRQLRRNFEAGDTVVDVIGFSRGAALALHFANTLEQGVDGHPDPIPVRFVGIWDTVPSFGVPGSPADPTFELDMPDNAARLCHAMALDERRLAFPLQRPEEQQQDLSHARRLHEVWFRGVHSDVGGGNGNNGLASISLEWMFAHAQAMGVPLDPAKVAENAARIKPATKISDHRFDLIKQRFRRVRSHDVVHESVNRRGDSDGREHNNPPIGLARVDNAGNPVGSFA
jgi:uncharacterized protein (DUF2235 family)